MASCFFCFQTANLILQLLRHNFLRFAPTTTTRIPDTRTASLRYRGPKKIREMVIYKFEKKMRKRACESAIAYSRRALKDTTLTVKFREMHNCTLIQF